MFLDKKEDIKDRYVIERCDDKICVKKDIRRNRLKDPLFKIDHKSILKDSKIIISSNLFSGLIISERYKLDMIVKVNNLWH